MSEADREIRDDTLEAIAPDLAAARDKWWRVWEEANPDGRGGSTLGYDIEQGWDAAWDCIEQFMVAAPHDLARTAAQAGLTVADAEAALMVGARMRAHGFTTADIDVMVQDHYRRLADRETNHPLPRLDSEHD